MKATLLLRVVAALEHLQYCGQCGEDSWASCSNGGRQAEELLAELQRKTKVIACEGCSKRETVALKHGIPAGWSQCGRSRNVAGALAAWCPNCRGARPLPSPPTQETP